MQIATFLDNPISRPATFASTRPVQIATRPFMTDTFADSAFASTRPVQIATVTSSLNWQTSGPLPPHAPCRLQQTCEWIFRYTNHPLPPHAPCRLQPDLEKVAGRLGLCLHTPRADCNNVDSFKNLLLFRFASTRPVQIATREAHMARHGKMAFASTRPVQIATTKKKKNQIFLAFASTRPVQIATAEMHRIAICTFQNVC